MAVEKIRQCGFRKVHSLYLVSPKGIAFTCDRLPLMLTPCPYCGSEIKFSRGIQRVDLYNMFGNHEAYKEGCDCIPECPICEPSIIDPMWLMYVGKEYSQNSFYLESMAMGVSKKIPYIPTDFEVGQWIVLARHNAVSLPRGHHPGQKNQRKIDAIFYAFKSTKIEYLIWQSEATPEYINELVEKGITPVTIPDGDEDHKRGEAGKKHLSNQQTLEEFD